MTGEPGGASRPAAIAPADPAVFVAFGATGDLTRRKLIPALWSLYAARTLPEPFTIVAAARTEMTDEVFRGQMRSAVGEFARLKVPSPPVWERFASHLHYLAGDPNGDELYPRLQQRLEELERARGGPTNRVFYCATPPSLYDDIVDHLGGARLARTPGPGCRRGPPARVPSGRHRPPARPRSSRARRG